MKRKRTNQVDVAKSFVDAQVDPEGYMIDIIPPKGRGVRTTKIREQGAFMLCYCGELISEEEGERREDQKDSAFRYFFNYKQKRFCVDATEEPKSGQKLGRLVNHGSKKERNCVMKVIEKNDQPYLCLFSSREIHPGEEILYDYGVNDLPWEKKSEKKQQPLPAAGVSMNVPTHGDSQNMLTSGDSVIVPTSGESLIMPTSGDSLIVPTFGDIPIVPTSDDIPIVPTLGDIPIVPTSGDSLIVPTSGDSLSMPTSDDIPIVPTSGDSLIVNTSGDRLHMPTSDDIPIVPTLGDIPIVPTSDDSLNVPTSGDSLSMPTSDDIPIVPTSGDSLIVPTSGDSLCMPTSDDIPIVPTSGDSLIVNTSGDSLRMPTSDDISIVPTLGDIPIVPTSDDSLSMPTSDDIPIVPTSGDSLIVNTSGDSLRMPTSDDLLIVPTLGDIPIVPTSGDSLSMPTSDDILIVPTSGDSLIVPTSGDSLIMPTSGDSLILPTSGDSLIVPTSGDSLSMPTSGDGLSMPTSGDGLSMPTSSDSMSMPTSDDLPIVPTSGDRLIVPTSSDSLSMPTSDDIPIVPTSCDYLIVIEPTSGDSLSMPTSGDSLIVPTSSESLIVPTSDDNLDVLTSGEGLDVPTSSGNLNAATFGNSHNVDTSGVSLNVAKSGDNLKMLFTSSENLKLPSSDDINEVLTSDSLKVPTSGENLYVADDDALTNDSYISDSSDFVPPTSDEDSTDSEIDRLSEVHAELQDLAVSTTTPIKQSQANQFLAAANQVEAADQIATNYQAVNQIEAADQVAAVFQTTSKDEAGWKPYFKNISVQVYNKKDGKRNYKKSDFCVYCKKEYDSKISNHLFACHKDKELVIEADSQPKESVQRIKILTKLQNEGNYMHNIEVLKNGSGRLVVCRRPKKDVDASKYIPCEFCLAFVTESLMWQHVKSCICRPCELESEKNYVRNGRLMIRKFVARDESETDDMNHELDKLISKMKETVANPGVKDICMKDKLIREFGISCLERLGLPEEQRTKDHDNIRTKMRSVGRLLQKLIEQKMNAQPLCFFLCPREFRNVVRGVKELSREANSPKLALNLGNYVKQISILKGSLAVEEEDGRKRQEAVDFRDHYNAHWTSRVSSVANRTMKLRTMNKRVSIPRTEDLVLLRNCVITEIDNCMKIQKPTYAEYVKLAWLLIVRIAMFTKRRISEVDELTVEDFGKRIFGEDTDGNAEIMESLDVTEKILYKRISLIEVRGKSTRALRKVYILLTEDVFKAINHLLKTRIYAGVNPANKFIFGRSGGTKLDGCEAMRAITASCVGLQRPELIRTRLLRKYLATTCQIMDMQEEELKMLADHMGHSLNIHTDVYHLQSSVLERTKVARVLLAVEAGQLNKYRYKGHCLDAVSIEELPEPEQEMEESDEEDDQPSVVSTTEEEEVEHMLGTEDSEPTPSVPKPNISTGIKRKRWTVQEGADLMDAFKVQIQEKRNVGTEAIGLARKKYKTLQDRTEAQIRTKINNIILGKCKK